MIPTIEHIVKKYERGDISRRSFIGGLAALFLAASAKQSAANGEQDSLFEAVDVNHVALRVTDVGRSREFYQRVLGLRGSGSFLYCGNDFVALFPGSQPGLDHFAFSVKGFDRDAAREILRKAGIEPIIEGPRTYFRDPDGIKLQIEAAR